MSDASPPWLVALQREFGRTLRRPLDRRSGTLRAETNDYPRELVSQLTDSSLATARERFAVYHRQYWFRLFGALQTAYPRVTRVLGAWTFNDFAARFVLAHPPSTRSLDDVAEGFAAFFTEELRRTSLAPELRLVLEEATEIDVAFRRCLRARPSRPLELTPSDAAELANRRLVLADGASILALHHDLFELRASLPLDAPVSALPPRSAEPKEFLLLRVANGTRRVALAPLEARLLRLLVALPLGIALERLEASVEAAERAALPALTSAFLSRTVRLGVWAHSAPFHDG